ncbi:MAG: alpha/beta fold hydrolase [Candidatus Niyogibacteria bacterium]|nr:alpha/beta fold hydrolase [Candidatus Niyogibacteria bacterium]
MRNRVKKAAYWVHDYLYALHMHSHAFLIRKQPGHYLGHVKEGKTPIVLIPGVYGKWNFLKAFADPLSRAGHPMYVLEHLGYNAKEIHHSAKLVRELIDEKKLHNVIILAHSKGGLIGKHVLAFDNVDDRVKKVIAIATPWKGSNIVKIFRHKSFTELHPESEIIKKLHAQNHVNHKIVSIFSEFDNHVWPTESCRLEGAKNIQVEVWGHHKILFNRNVRDIVIKEVE